MFLKKCFSEQTPPASSPSCPMSRWASRMGKSRHPHAYHPQPKKAALWSALPRQVRSHRTIKALQRTTKDLFEGLTIPTWHSLVPTEARKTEECRTCTAQKKQVTYKDRAASISHSPTCSQPVGEDSTPRSSPTFRHIVFDVMIVFHHKGPTITQHRSW